MTTNENAAVVAYAGVGGPEEKLRLVDVGGAGGLKREWEPFRHQVFPILFEPNPTEAADLRESLRKSGGEALVLETALASVAGAKTLNLTSHWGCVSLLTPNMDFLSAYRIARLYNVTGHAEVSCVRYDTLFFEGRVPAPDVIKVDVQGYEYEVVQGFGSLLETCLGVEVEADLYPVYHGQKLLHDIIRFLADFGFALRAVYPKRGFDGDLVELDARFTKNRTAWERLSPKAKDKFKLLCKVWSIPDYGRIDPAMPPNHLMPPID